MLKVENMTIGEKFVVTKGEQGELLIQDILHMQAETRVIDGRKITVGTFELSAVRGNNEAQVSNEEENSTDSSEIQVLDNSTDSDIQVLHNSDDSSDEIQYVGTIKPKPKEKPKAKKTPKRIVFEENLDDEEVAVEFSQAQTFTALVHTDDDA